MSDDPKAPTQENVPSRRVAALSDPSSPAGTPAVAAVAAATLTDSDFVEDSAPRARGGGPFRAITDWLAPAVAADALRRMDRGIDGDVYFDVLGTHPGVDPTSLSSKITQERLVNVDQHLKALRGSPALRTLVDALAKPGRLDRVRSCLATEAAKAELDARVLALRERARLDEVWRVIEPQFAADALFDWAEQRLHRANGIAKTLSDAEWRATLERVSLHEVVINGERVRVRVQSHEAWIRAAVEEELRATTLVSPRKADLWIDDLSLTIKPDAARALVEQAITNAGGRVGEVASANPLMNVRGRSVASPDALVALCASDDEARADVRDKLKHGKLSAVLENWIDGIIDERDRQRPKELLGVLTWAEQTWKQRDPEMGLQAFLWAAGEKRLRIGEDTVTTLTEFVAVIDARVARLSLPLGSGALELWVRHAVGDPRLASIARASASQGEIGAWTFIWAAGESRLRLGRRVVRSVDELCAAIRSHEDARRSAGAALADGLLSAWLRHAQKREDLGKVVVASRKLPSDVAVWELAYAGGLAELDVRSDVSVTTVADLASWLRGHLHAFAARLDQDHLAARLRFWLTHRTPSVDFGADQVLKRPRAQLHELLWKAGFHEVWLDDKTSFSDAAALAEYLAEHPARIDAASKGAPTFSEVEADHALVLALLASDRPAFLRELGAPRSSTLRNAAVIRRLNPARPIVVAGELHSDDDPVVLAKSVMAAVDRQRVWVDLDAARLVMQELSMTMQARGAQQLVDRLDSALGIVSLPSEPFRAEDVTCARVLRAAFMFHIGPRPFRPERDEIRTLINVGWYFARQPTRWNDELAAIERKLWLEQEGHGGLGDRSLSEFLCAVFPERTSASVDVLAVRVEGNVIEVTWTLKLSISVLGTSAIDPTQRYMDDATSLELHTSQLIAPSGSAPTRASALGDILLARVVASTGLDPARITNAASLGASILAAEGSKQEATIGGATQRDVVDDTRRLRSVDFFNSILSLSTIDSEGFVEAVQADFSFREGVVVSPAWVLDRLADIRRVMASLTSCETRLVAAALTQQAEFREGAGARVLARTSSGLRSAVTAWIAGTRAILEKAFSDFATQILSQADDDDNSPDWIAVVGLLREVVRDPSWIHKNVPSARAMSSTSDHMTLKSIVTASMNATNVAAGSVPTLSRKPSSLDIAALNTAENEIRPALPEQNSAAARPSWAAAFAVTLVVIVALCVVVVVSRSSSNDRSADRLHETRFIATTRASLRQGPSNDAPEIALLPINTPCDVIGIAGGASGEETEFNKTFTGTQATHANVQCDGKDGFIAVEQLSREKQEPSRLLADARSASSLRDTLKLAARSSAIAQSAEADALAREAFFRIELQEGLDVVRREKRKKPFAKIARTPCRATYTDVDCIRLALGTLALGDRWTRFAIRGRDFSAASSIAAKLETRSGRFDRSGDMLTVRIEFISSSEPITMNEILTRDASVLVLTPTPAKRSRDATSERAPRTQQAEKPIELIGGPPLPAAVSPPPPNPRQQ